MKGITVRLILLAGWLATSVVLCAQSSLRYTQYVNNQAYLEVGGTGILYALNYDRVLWRDLRNKLLVVGGIGFSYYPHYSLGVSHTYFPLKLAVLAGKAPLYAEMSYHYIWGWEGIASISFPGRWYVNKDWQWLPFFGFRYQMPQSGLFFRGGIYPIVYNTDYAVRRIWWRNDSYLYRLSLNSTIIDAHERIEATLWFGASIGYSFRWRSKTYTP